MQLRPERRLSDGGTEVQREGAMHPQDSPTDTARCMPVEDRVFMRITEGLAMRVTLYDGNAAKRPVNLTLNGDLVRRARAEGLNLSALAEQAVAAALARLAREKLAAEIAQGCAAHEQYLAEYGSLGDAVRASAGGE
jgi:antitoxin CcdA